MSFHLAGIIPLAGQPLDFKMPWHDALMPLSPDYLAVERSVLECAYAGCEAIWIVCNDDMSPLVRHKIGEFVQDPIWYYRRFERDKQEFQKKIPIYYVPIHPKDRNKRDCLGWSVLHGAYSANDVASKLSTWLKPDKYYVSFPYGYYSPEELRKWRKEISSHRRFFLSHEGKTVSDGEYLGFTFTKTEYEKLVSEVKQKSTGLWNKDRTEKLPLDKRFSYRFFSLKEVFESLKPYKKYEIKEYWKLDNWKSYCEFIGTKGPALVKPPEYILKYHEWNDIGVDED